MSEDSTNNSLINLGQSKTVDRAYKDILSPPGKKAGMALSTILDTGNTLLWPIKWVNERTRIFFENNIKNYEDRLNKVEEEEIIPVPSEISIPIMDRFTYTSNEELSKAFINLLLSASLEKTANIAHPGFIYLIDRLSPDEAILLQYLKDNTIIPLLSLKHFNQPKDLDEYVHVFKNRTGLESQISNLNFVQNINVYLDNLESLGLIQMREYYYTSLEPAFDRIINENQELIDITFEMYSEDHDLENIRSFDRRMYELTDFGELFIQACFTNEI